MSNRDYDELFIRGTNAQREELEEKERKNGFDNIGIPYALRTIEEKIDELRGAIRLAAVFDQEIDYTTVRHTAADIANFAHMIILKCDKELEKKTPAGG